MEVLIWLNFFFFKIRDDELAQALRLFELENGLEYELNLIVDNKFNNRGRCKQKLTNLNCCYLYYARNQHCQTSIRIKCKF